MAKVNFGAGLKLRYLAAVRRALANDEANPHVLLGMGGPARTWRQRDGARCAKRCWSACRRSAARGRRER